MPRSRFNSLKRYITITIKQYSQPLLGSYLLFVIYWHKMTSELPKTLDMMVKRKYKSSRWTTIVVVVYHVVIIQQSFIHTCSLTTSGISYSSTDILLCLYQTYWSINPRTKCRFIDTKLFYKTSRALYWRIVIFVSVVECIHVDIKHGNWTR